MGNGFEVGAGDAQQTAVRQAERFDEAYRALRADDAIQFDLSKAPPPPEPPYGLRAVGRWLRDVFRPVGRAIDWITAQMPEAPYARILLWSVLVAVALALVWLTVQRLRTGEWRLPRFRRRPAEHEEEYWQPEAAPARTWLEEADALAAQGDFAAAVHHLLRRSIDDIDYRRPQLVRPALTSRDLAAADAIPPRARSLFAGIVAIVERSLFGGRAVSAGEWAETRSAYADFAQAGAWRA